MWVCELGSGSDLEQGPMIPAHRMAWEVHGNEDRSRPIQHPVMGGMSAHGWSFRSILAVPQTSKHREDVSNKGRELLEILFPYLYGQTFMPVWGQMVVYFYPNPKGGDLSPDANSSLSHVHTVALSSKEMLLLQFWDVNNRDWIWKRKEGGRNEPVEMNGCKHRQSVLLTRQSPLRTTLKFPHVYFLARLQDFLYQSWNIWWN